MGDFKPISANISPIPIASQITYYQFHLNGHLWKLTDANGNTREWLYNQRGQLREKNLVGFDQGHLHVAQGNALGIRYPFIMRAEGST